MRVNRLPIIKERFVRAFTPMLIGQTAFISPKPIDFTKRGVR